MNSELDAERISVEVMAAFNSLVNAARTLDHDRYFALLDKQEFTALNHDGTVTHSFEEFESSFREQVRHLKHYNKLEFQNVRVSVIASEVCVLVNEYHAEIVLMDDEVAEMRGAGTQVWRKRPEGWFLTHVSSSIKP